MFRTLGRQVGFALAALAILGVAARFAPALGFRGDPYGLLLPAAAAVLVGLVLIARKPLVRLVAWHHRAMVAALTLTVWAAWVFTAVEIWRRCF